MNPTSKLRQHIDRQLDARQPSEPCIGCGRPTRTPDYLCADCARENHTSCARINNRSDVRDRAAPRD